MIAPALIPSMAIVGMALASADPSLAGKALERWAVDAAIVMVVGGLLLFGKQLAVHRRRTAG